MKIGMLGMHGPGGICSSRKCLGLNLEPFSIARLWYLAWERDYMWAYPQIRKWRPLQQSVTTEWAFIDQGKFEATKTLNRHRPPRCDKHEFYAKMTVSTLIIFEISLLNIVVLTRMKNTKNAL